MKRINIIAAVLCLFATSCEDIEFGNNLLEEPVSDLTTIEDVFKSEYYADQVLTRAYQELPDHLTDNRVEWGVLESMTDLGEKCNGSSYYQSGSISSSSPINKTPIGKLQEMITAIRYAYIYIENVDNVPDMSSTLKNQRKAEAKVIIAYLYSEMFRYMGGVPMMTKAYSANDDLTMPRPSVEKMVNDIVKLCDDAVKDLPWSVKGAECGRMTAAAAIGVKFRTLLFAASPLFNCDEPYMPEAKNLDCVYYGNYDAKRWQRALDAGLEFVAMNKANGNHYKLVGEIAKGNAVPDPVADFVELRNNFANGYFTRDNGELIIEGHRFVTYYNSNKWGSQYRFGSFTPTSNLHDMFQMSDGTPFDWNNPKHSSDPFFEDLTQAAAIDKTIPLINRRDPRMYETLQLHGDIMQGQRVDITDVDLVSMTLGTSTKGMLASNMGMRKYIRGFGFDIQGQTYCCSLMRTPEIYLSIAECMNELSIANVADKYGNTAYDYVNIIRNRVGMPSIAQSGKDAHLNIAEGEDLANYILDERAREFAYEEVRYYDIMRRKRDDILKKAEVGISITKNDSGSYDYTPNLALPNGRVWIENWSNRYFLNFIPLDEVQKDYGLVQNPGW